MIAFFETAQSGKRLSPDKFVDRLGTFGLSIDDIRKYVSDTTVTIQDLCDCGATPEGCAELLRGGREVRVDFGNDCDDHLYGDALREQIMPLDDE